jgi:glycosyltransferase involved in cell wall biosynthesis
MHVAQFVHRYPPAIGGAEAWAERLARALVAAGDRVTVWTTTAVDLSAFRERGHRETQPGVSVEDDVTIRRFRPGARWPGRRLTLKAASLLPFRSWQAMTVPWTPVSLAMWRAAGRAGDPPDVVHATAFPYGSVIRCGLRLARRHRVPFVVTPFLHLGDPDDPSDRGRRAYTSPNLRWLLRQADRVIVQTPTEADAVRAMGIPEARIVPQGLGVDPSECTGGDRAASRAAWGIGSNEVVIGHLANQSPEKGTIDLLRAAAEVRKAGLPIRLVLAGPMMPSFLRFWQTFAADNWVKQLGPLTSDEKRHFFAGLDAFALPSRSDSFGLVFLEAWANRLAVIGYRAGGVADLIRHEMDGLLVKCGDLDGLADAMRRLASDAARREQMGREGQNRLDKDFRWADKIQIARRALVG